MNRGLLPFSGVVMCLLSAGIILSAYGEWDDRMKIKDETIKTVTGSVMRLKMDDVTDAARAGFHRILERVPLESAEDYGFYGLEGLTQAELGIPMPVYTVEVNDALVVPVNQWRVPVMVDGSYRALLTVAYVDGSLQAVALGGRDLSQELQSAQAALGGGNRQPLAILRLYSLRIDFVFDPSSLNSSGPLDRIFYPLKSARSRLGIDESMGLTEVMSFIDQQRPMTTERKKER